MNVRTDRLCNGRALYIGAAGTLYVSRRYEIFRSDDWGKTWQLDCFVPPRGWKALASRARLAARLLRYYIAALQVLPDGSRVAVARDGIYRAAPGETRMTRSFRIVRGSRPLNLSLDGNRLMFGEYGANLARHEVFIYVSEDGGRTFDVGFRLPRGEVEHIHNVFVDPYEPNGYWVFAGDYGRYPGIGLLSKDMRTIEWVQRAHQNCRVVSAIAEADALLFGTDTDCEQNCIARLDRKDGKIRELLKVDASSLHATAFGPVRLISTSGEPNPICQAPQCAIYASRDGERWDRITTATKDRHNSMLFQFGSLVLPYAFCDRPCGMFSGQAVKNIDNQTLSVSFD